MRVVLSYVVIDDDIDDIGEQGKYRTSYCDGEGGGCQKPHDWKDDIDGTMSLTEPQ